MAQGVTGRVPAPLLVLAAVVSVQFGGALAATLVPVVDVFGSVTLRLTIAAAILLAGVRPRLRARTIEDWVAVGTFGAVLALMNLFFYAGASWAAYIIFSSRTGARFAQLDGLAIAMTIATFLVAPVGLVTGASALWIPDALWRGAAIALMSSVLPYSLELIALRRLPAHVFGILLSVEPAVAALAGLLVLGQHLGAVQLIGMACVVAASALVPGSKSAPSPPAALAETTNQ